MGRGGWGAVAGGLGGAGGWPGGARGPGGPSGLPAMGAATCGRLDASGLPAMGAAALPSSSSLSSASSCAPGAPAAGRSSASYLRTSMSTSAAATGGVGTSASTRRRPERPCPRWRGALEALELERAACGHGADFAGSGAAGRGRAGVGVDLEREPRLIRAAGGRWGGQEGFEGLAWIWKGLTVQQSVYLGGSL